MKTNVRSRYFSMTIVALMVAITFVLMSTPLGTISLGPISLTIAHIPILITTLVIGFKEGFVVALSFGIISLIKAATAPRGVLDPLFVNPMISILPRVLIPVTTFWVNKALSKYQEKIAVIAAVVVGNLTNTFFVYFSMYLFAKSQVELKTGKGFATTILGLVSSTTAIKTVLVVLITTPIVLALRRYTKQQA